MSAKIREAHELAEDAAKVAMIPVILRDLFDTSSDAQVVINSEGYIVLFNKKARLMFGWKEEEVIGKPIEILLPESKREIHVKHRAGYAKDPYDRAMGANLNLEACHRKGHNFSVVIDLHPLEPEAGEVYTRAAIRHKHMAVATPTSSALEVAPESGAVAAGCPFPHNLDTTLGSERER